MNTIKEISTAEVQSLLSNKDVVLLDVRPVDAYNGWSLSGERRGGHIPGARIFPVKWASYWEWQDILRSKNITRDKKIVVYAYQAEDSRKVAGMLLKAGYAEVSVYDAFVGEWVADEALPLDKLPRYRNLVPASWLRELIHGGSPAGYDNDSFVVVHAHYRNREAYLSGHIPEAIDMDTLALEAPETWNRRSPRELKEAMQQHGITADTTVVLYGKFMSPDNADDFPGSAAGHIGAIRNAMIMLYAGVKDVRILNGGYQAWLDAGYEQAYDDVAKKPVDDFGVGIPAHPEIIVDIQQAKEMLRSSDADLVCVRSRPEYIGEVSGYNYIEKKGRIPGALFADCGTDAYHMENYRHVDHTVREAQEVADIWEKSGIVPEKHLAFYCGTGWRGSEAFFNAWLMAWPRVSVFDGGWFEWSNDPENPYETGVPDEENRIKESE